MTWLNLESKMSDLVDLRVESFNKDIRIFRGFLEILVEQILEINDNRYYPG